MADPNSSYFVLVTLPLNPISIKYALSIISRFPSNPLLCWPANSCTKQSNISFPFLITWIDRPGGLLKKMIGLNMCWGMVTDLVMSRCGDRHGPSDESRPRSDSVCGAAHGRSRQLFLNWLWVLPGLSRIAIRHRQSEQKADLTGAIPLLYEFDNTSGSEIADENSPI
jgi:hypothetical protein